MPRALFSVRHQFSPSPSGGCTFAILPSSARRRGSSDHEHVKIEQTYMLEGTLVDKEGPVAGLSVGPGEFVWREAGTRHVAWTPEGGLMLAMFQVPNKFFEADGRVTRVFRDRARKADGGEPARTR